jgi:arylsulfatase A-like enzyme
MKESRRRFLTAAAAGLPALIGGRAGAAADRPNVLWILGDDLGCELGCYGDPVIRTPNIDRLANEGVRFSQFHTTAPVCSASRSGFNTGVYQSTTGTHNHRSHRGDGYTLPEGVRLASHRFRDAGYFTCNVLDLAEGVRGTGKTDYNFSAEKPFQGTHWNQRKPGQPFYAQINFQAPHKGAAFTAARKRKDLTDPKKVPLPPFYPDHPVVRNEVANYSDAVQLLDYQVGVVLEKLAQDKLLDNTVIFMFGDNGRCLLRGKQWLYDHGTHVPLIVRWPGVAKPGAVRDELAISLDMTATSLMAAGIPIPGSFHGRPLFGPKAQPREFVVTARDRCDMTPEHVRAVRDKRYRYIRNFDWQRPYTQFSDYIERFYPTLGVMKELHAAGKLTPAQELWMAPRKPKVEFYDCQADPHQVDNLAEDPGHRQLLAQFTRRLDDWMAETNDKGGTPEPPREMEQAWKGRKPPSGRDLQVAAPSEARP